MSGHQYLTGDDWNRGLPTEPVVYRGKPKATGLDWDAIRAKYIANGGIETPEIFADAVTVVHHSGRPSTYGATQPKAAPRKRKG